MFKRGEKDCQLDSIFVPSFEEMKKFSFWVSFHDTNFVFFCNCLDVLRLILNNQTSIFIFSL